MRELLGFVSEVPLASHVGVVPAISKYFREGHHSFVQVALVAWLKNLHPNNRFETAET